MKLVFIGIFFLIIGCTQNSGQIAKVCLEGHTYLNYKNMLALKVDDQGIPIKCPSDPLKNSNNIELTEKAKNWLKFIDEKDFRASWDNTSPFFKSAISQKEWDKAGSEVTRQIGKLLKRVHQNSQIDGMRATIIFKSDFEKFPQATETVSMIMVEGKWMIAGYLVK